MFLVHTAAWQATNAAPTENQNGYHPTNGTGMPVPYDKPEQS